MQYVCRTFKVPKVWYGLSLNAVFYLSLNPIYNNQNLMPMI